ncbi:MAG: ankyrin repeat domain-containing protein [Chlamydiales bacterium]|nr:ankyrin repeat domain-containing protein [Chlamydiales bacterium]
MAIQALSAFKHAIIETAQDAKTAVQDLLTIYFDYDMTKGSTSIQRHLVKQILQHSLNNDLYSITALFTEVVLGNTHLTKRLIRKGIDLESKGVDGKNALNLAFENGHFRLALKLVKMGASLESLTPEEKLKLLNHAIETQDLKSAKMMISSGMDINQPVNEYQDTLLHVAVMTPGNEKVIQFLLENGAHPDYMNRDEMAPIHLTTSISYLKLLVEKGKASVKTSYPLITLERLRDHSDAARYLVEKGASINQPDLDGNTPLHEAAKEKEFLPILKFLLEKGAKIDLKNKNGETPLEIAIDHNNAAALPFLLKEQTISPGRYLLHKAIPKQNHFLVHHLVTHGASLNETDPQGNTPIDLLIQSKSALFTRSILNLFEEQIEMKSSYILKSLHIRNEALAQEFLEKGADINAPNEQGITPLQDAFDKQDTYIARFLLKNGATFTKQEGFLYLQHALLENNVPMVKLLQQYKVDINTPVGGGKTLLHLAIERRDLKKVQQLLHLGCKTSVQDDEGMSPLHLAVVSGNKELLRHVISQENVNAVNRQGQTALMMAENSRDPGFKAFARQQIGLIARSVVV